jgi:membrane protein DedA with SNARE-associated domain
MTLGYLAETYRVPIAELLSRLGLPADAPKDTSLKRLADRQQISPFTYVSRVQQAIAELVPPSRGLFESQVPEEGIMDWVATRLLRYGYGALALVLLLGAIGLPLPIGLSAALAGSLVALGRMHWLAAVGVAIAASVVGDMIGYGAGRAVGDRVLVRHGRWLGYNESRREQLDALFARWDWLAIVLSRTLVSSLSAPVNLAAGGLGRSVPLFLASVVVGRAVWTTAYIGLGYVVAGNIEAAAEFLKNLTGLLLSTACAGGLMLYLRNERRTKRTTG